MSEKCCGRTYDNHRFWPCAKPAKYEADGKHYCGIHNPAAKEKRRAKSEAKWAAEMRQMEARTAEKKAVEADARRYRWLRERHDDDTQESFWHVRDHNAHPVKRGELDAAIDAAMEADTRYTLTDAGRDALEKSK